MADVPANVFVVDDDVSVRESLESAHLECRWQPETFASAAGIPVSPLIPGTKLFGARRDASGA